MAEMSLADIAPELISQIYNTLYSINDVVNLSLTCRHLNHLLKHSQKLSTLFSVAEREFGPTEDIAQLVTYNASQPVHVRRQPAQSYALLRQMIKIGNVAQKYVEIFPERKWRDNYLERRALTHHEAWKIRRAIYRYWLYCEAFQNRAHSRATRMLSSVIEERSQLLRTWSTGKSACIHYLHSSDTRTEDLVDIEDVRLVIEDLLSIDLCPTDGAARADFNQYCDFSDVRFTHNQYMSVHKSWNSWPPDSYTSRLVTSNMFHNSRNEQFLSRHLDLPVPQRRKLEMTGWGDDISQYYVVQAMMKLNPAQIMFLYEHVTTRQDVEKWLFEHVGEEWFWDNGETWFDTWRLVLYKRGEDFGMLRDAIIDGDAGIVAASSKDIYIATNTCF